MKDKNGTYLVKGDLVRVSDKISITTKTASVLGERKGKAVLQIGNRKIEVDPRELEVVLKF